jgi:hypothetical protein
MTFPKGDYLMNVIKKIKLSILAVTMVAGSLVATNIYEKPSIALAENAAQIKTEDIRFFRTIPEDRQQVKNSGLVEHQEAIALIQNYIDEKNMQITVDLDNENFQQFAKSFGFSFGSYNDEDMDKL